MQSIWEKTVNIPQRESLSHTLDTDIAIIGAGLTGVLTGYFLQQAGRKVILLDAKRIGSGQTRNTTAKITSQHNLIYHKLINKLGIAQAQQYADANQDAIAAYRNLITEQDIDCDFETCNAYLYSTKEAEPLLEECKAAKRLGIDADCIAQTELPFPVVTALRFSNQARFNPLKFILALSNALEIYENTPVLKVKDNCLITEQATVNAKNIIFACHYPFINVPGYYFMRMHQERSYVLALKNAQSMKGMYLSIDQDALSFRPYQNTILLGGGSHRTGENAQGGKYSQLREAAKKYWPQSEELAAWSAQDCMTLDEVPYIGQFSSTTPNWYVATGYQKWGMTSSMLAARLLTNLLHKGEHPLEEVFSPQRFTPTSSTLPFIKEAMQATKGLSRSWFMPPRATIAALPNGHGGIVEVDGEKVGVYKDDQGQAFVVSIHCPHLGCQLEWNPDEKSWDCPCHGSRFDYHGQLIDNPAQENLPFEKLNLDMKKS